MSNIYVQEPPTSGKVVLTTTLGELEIELWSKECPKACRNFLQLCVDGYYDNTIFHSVVPNFIAQGGDPTGTGHGGESIYGEPFKNELHSRLRFVRRGLVATANSGNNDNVSQFFFTLGPTPELQNKHSIFGRVTGNTVFNMMKFNDLDTDREGRPLYPPKIIKTEVIVNPFPDIQPKATSVEEKSNEIKLPVSKGKKNLKLLSFADEEDFDENDGSISSSVVTKAKTSHDVANNADSLNRKSLPEDVLMQEEILEKNKTEMPAVPDVSEAKNTERGSSDQSEKRDNSEEKVETRIDKLKSIKDEVRSVKRSLKAREDDKDVTKEDVHVLEDKSSHNNDVLKQFHEEQLKYADRKRANIKKKGDGREMDTLSRLESFRRKLHEASSTLSGASEPSDEDTAHPESDSWLGHKLQFEEATPVLAKDANTKDDDWFDIYDPRNPLNKRRRQTSKK